MNRPRFSNGEQVRVAQGFKRKAFTATPWPPAKTGERCRVWFNFTDKEGVPRYRAEFEDGSVAQSAAEYRLMSEFEWDFIQNLKGIN